VCAPIATAPTAHANGLANCNESDAELHADAQHAIERISDAGLPLGPYEDSSTVLLFVASSLKGIEAK
jgi:phosphohistidine phosphatase